MQSSSILPALAKADLLGSPWIPASFVPTVDLHITFPDSGKVVEGGNSIKPLDAACLPLIEFVAEDLTSPALYTLVSIDPDAPSRSNQSAGPWRHCVIDGLQPASLAEISLHATSTPAQEKALVRRTKEEVICEWTGPSPPTGTGDHRYMFLLYRETKPIVPLAEQTTIKSNSRFDRRSFNLAGYVEQNGLVLVGANYFLCANADSSPL